MLNSLSYNQPQLQHIPGGLQKRALLNFFLAAAPRVLKRALGNFSGAGAGAWWCGGGAMQVETEAS